MSELGGRCEPHGYDESVAVKTSAKLDARVLRRDFPIFEQEIHGKPLAYLDSANTSQKPRQVLDGMTKFYETSYANVHRAVHVLAERATSGLEGAREKIGTLSEVAYALAENLPPPKAHTGRRRRRRRKKKGGQQARQGAEAQATPDGAAQPKKRRRRRKPARTNPSDAASEQGSEPARTAEAS